MANIQHPTIIKFYGYSEISFDNTNCLTLIMDIAARGSHKNYLGEIKKDRNNPDFDNTPLQIILIGISRGMMKLHEMKRDLKIENVLLNEFNYPLIADFGLSKILEDTSPKEQSKSVSSAIITAPEMILGEKYTISVDVYAFGIILYEIVTNLQPYDGISMYKIIEGVPKGLRPQIPEKTPKTF